jgi:hypothetical protein
LAEKHSPGWKLAQLRDIRQPVDQFRGHSLQKMQAT